MARRVRSKGKVKSQRREQQAYSRAVGYAAGDIKFSARLSPEDGWYRCNGFNRTRADNTRLYNALCPTFSGTTTSGSATITGIEDTSDFESGMPIEGPGLGTTNTINTVLSSTSISVNINAGAGFGSGEIRLFPYGNGDGSTTFTLPDLRGRTIVGQGDGTGAFLTNRVLGEEGGEESSQLTTSEMPSHAHGSTTSTDGSHAHVVRATRSGDTTATGAFQRVTQLEDAPAGAHTGTTGSAGNHAHTISASGGGLPFNNMPPYAVVNAFIKR